MKNKELIKLKLLEMRELEKTRLEVAIKYYNERIEKLENQIIELENIE